MKKKLGAVLLVVTLTLSFGLVPVASVGASSVTGVGPMAIAPYGVIYAAVYDGTSWAVQKSNYGGRSWKATSLTDAGGPIAQIVVSPNYRKDRTVYVAVYDPPTVYRVTDSSFVPLQSIKDRYNNFASELYSIDVWFDGEYNWVLAGTDLGVCLLWHRFGETWRDMELDKPAFEVNFAPDFDQSELIWALTSSDTDGDYLLTSTLFPGGWGTFFSDAEFDGVPASMGADLDFPDDYSSEVPLLFAAVTDGSDMDPTDRVGGIFRIRGSGDGTLRAVRTMNSEDMVSLAVCGNVLLSGALFSPSIYRSTNEGLSWQKISENPSGECWTHVNVIPQDFAPITRLVYAATFGDGGGVFCSHDLGSSWSLVSSKLFG